MGEVRVLAWGVQIQQVAQANLKRLSTDGRSMKGLGLGGSNPAGCASKSKETKHGSWPGELKSSKLRKQI
jgi:hypothetical protein